MLDGIIKLPSVCICRWTESHWCSTVPVSTPLCDESGEFAAFLIQLRLVEPIVCICCCFICMLWNPRHQVEWHGRVMGFSKAAGIESLIIHCAPWSPKSLWYYYHSSTPFCGFTLRGLSLVQVENIYYIFKFLIFFNSIIDVLYAKNISSVIII